MEPHLIYVVPVVAIFHWWTDDAKMWNEIQGWSLSKDALVESS